MRKGKVAKTVEEYLAGTAGAGAVHIETYSCGDSVGGAEGDD